MTNPHDNGLIMKYFVLKPHGTSPYHRASRAAMRAYAAAIDNTNPGMADDIMKWVKREDALAKLNAESPTVIEPGEKVVLPFWVDNQTWVYSLIRGKESPRHYLLHVPTNLEAHSNTTDSPYKACIGLREMIERNMENPHARR